MSRKSWGLKDWKCVSKILEIQRCVVTAKQLRPGLRSDEEIPPAFELGRRRDRELTSVLPAQNSWFGSSYNASIVCIGFFALVGIRATGFATKPPSPWPTARGCSADPARSDRQQSATSCTV
jgi:hypothetical protein